jgi:hypothetical protein
MQVSLLSLLCEYRPHKWSHPSADRIRHDKNGDGFLQVDEMRLD